MPATEQAGRGTNPVGRHRHGRVLELRLENPPINGLTGPLLAAYVEALQAAQHDDGVGAVVTTSALATWCVGGDLNQMDADGRDLSDILHESTGELESLSLLERQADQLGAGRHVLAINAFDKPLVAAIGGASAGGGMALALLHDIRFGSDRAVFSVAFTRIGLSMEMGLSYLLPRAIGPQAAFDLASTGRRVRGSEALALGLLWRLVPDDELVPAALAYAEQLAALPPLGVQMTKRLLRRSWDQTLERQLETEWPWQVAAYRSPESRAAIEQFLRQRTAQGDDRHTD